MDLRVTIVGLVLLAPLTADPTKDEAVGRSTVDDLIERLVETPHPRRVEEELPTDTNTSTLPPDARPEKDPGVPTGSEPEGGKGAKVATSTRTA